MGQEAEFVTMAWRFDGARSWQNDTVEVIADILANGAAGLFDLNLNQNMKVLDSGAFIDQLNDYSSLVVMANPHDDQPMTQVRELLLGEVEKLKAGDWDDELLTAVVNNKKRDYYRSINNNRNRTEMMVDAFINGKTWNDVATQLTRMQGITKQQISYFARRQEVDNFVCVYKALGVDTLVKKIDTPAITPIPSNRHLQSQFLADISNSKVEPVKPDFVDFNEDLSFTNTLDGLPIIYKQNTQDGLFSLRYKYDFGQSADRRYTNAFDYMNYLGTKSRSAEEFQKEMYYLACEYSFSCDDETIYVTVSGLAENMNQAVELAEDLLNNAQVDREAWDNTVAMTLKSRADAKTNQGECDARLRSWGTYGPRNTYTDIMSEQELRDADPQTMIDLVKALLGYKHTVLYFGPLSQQEFTATIARLHKTAKNLADVPANNPYVAQETPTQEVYIAPYDAKNIYMTQYNNNSRTWNVNNSPVIALFNEYFGSGMNTIVFQELREARGLAYHASARYVTPADKGRNEYFYTYVITQNDKMMDCINQFNCIIDTLPQSQTAFDLAKDALIKRYESSRTTRDAVIFAYIASQRRGIDKSIDEVIYNALPSLSMQDMVDFEQETMVRRPYHYLILGNEEELDMDALSKVGPIHRLTLEQIFGY